MSATAAAATAADAVLPAMFTAYAGDVELTCCLDTTQNSNGLVEYELLVVDAVRSRAWSTTFTVAAVNTALQDEELSTVELSNVLATVLPCQQAVTAVLQPTGQLRLEAWCHRTERVALLPPKTHERRPDSSYRQAAFCVSLPVSQDLDAPQYMLDQQGQPFANINKRLLAAMLHGHQAAQDAVLRLQAQLELLRSHTVRLQLVADWAVATAVRGTAGLKDNPPKLQRQQTQKEQQQQQPGLSPGKSDVSKQSQAGRSNILSSQAGLGLLLGSQQVANGGTGGGIPVQRAGSGGSSRPFAGATSTGGRAHLARQSQDEKALVQLWNEQQALAQDWQQVQQLVACKGPLEAFVQLAREAGCNGVVAGAGQGHALPRHLGQEQQQVSGEGHQQQQLQEKGGGVPSAGAAGEPAMHSSAAVSPGRQGGSRAEALAAAAAAASPVGPGPQMTRQGSAANAASPGLVAVVAPARQKTGAKRKAHDGHSLLKRGRR